MIATIAYFTVLLAVLVYLAKYGGKTGLWAGSLQLASWFATLLVVLILPGTPYLIPALNCVDFLSFGWKTAIAMKSNRRWPIWMTAFQLNVVAAHVTIWIVPHWKTDLYYAMFTVWSIPSLLVMIVGTELDRRHSLKIASF